MAHFVVPKGLQQLAGRLSEATPPGMTTGKVLNPGGIPEK